MLDNISVYFNNKNKSILHKYLCGLEKESNRICNKGFFSKNRHPKNLGHPLTHPNFTLDFANTQLEIMTMPFDSFERALSNMKNLSIYAMQNLGSDLLWPLSMPPKICNEIELANFGSSKKGLEKNLYRKGLANRYGAKMQTISGVHFNFSFQNEFWNEVKKNDPRSLKAFKTDNYLKIIRSFLEKGWLLTYLFGASPKMDISYLGFEADKDYPNATSFRMSHFGYYSKVQKQLAISFDSLEDYLLDMKAALQNKEQRYANIKQDSQLNDSILQTAAEHYSRIKPKANIHRELSILDTLSKQGIEYLEIRSLDLNPFEITSISLQQMQFLHLFLLYLLFSKNKIFNKKEYCTFCENQNRVALYGRDQKLTISHNGKKARMKDIALSILDEMKPIADLLDSNQNREYSELIKEMKSQVQDTKQTLSSKLAKCDFIKTGLELAHMQKTDAISQKRSSAFLNQMQERKTDSFLEEKKYV